MAFASDKTRQGTAGVSTGGYSIDNSLRFNDDDNSQLERTFTSAGDRQKWTWSAWIKRGNISTNMCLFSAKSNTGMIWLAGVNGTMRVEQYNGAGGYNFRRNFEGYHRDASAWYHLIIVYDSAQASEVDRLKFYRNGEAVGVNYTYESMSQNFQSEFNNTETHWLGAINHGFDYDGLLAEVNFVDGQALTPSDFGETGDYGEWKAKKYTGTYGTNGFYLDFKNSGSLGNDASSNSNNWTPNNLAATDQMLDSPTNNFCTLNVVNQVGSSLIISEGNTNFFPSASTGTRAIESSMSAPSSGKYYFEICTVSKTQGNWNYGGFGLKYTDSSLSSSYSYGGAGTNYVFANLYHNSNYGDIGTRANFWTNTNQPATLTVFQVAVDSDNDKIYLGKNNTWYGSADPANNTGTAWLNGGFGSGGMSFYFSGTLNQEMMVNFGQDSSFAGNKTAQGNQDSNSIGDFYYTPPTGFLALCTSNLPDPAVIPSEHFNTVLYSGTGSSASITGVGFQPDFVWIKRTNGVEDHRLTDVVRGVNLTLRSNTYNTEYTGNDVTAFNSDGFTNGGDSDDSGETYVAWNWKLNGTGVTNNDGSITSSVSANVESGVSLLTYTGTGSGGTVGHGLDSKPEIVIIKNTEFYGASWTANVGNIAPFSASADMTAMLSATNYIIGYNVGGTYWVNVLPDDTKFTISNQGATSRTGEKIFAICIHSVDGFSKLGSYTGNGSTDGTFVYTGFRPKYVMIKNATSVGHWQIHDTTRDTYNVMGYQLHANASDADGASSAYYIDSLSNGFKLRMTHAGQNASGSKYLFIAFAEHPFKYTNAR